MKSRGILDCIGDTPMLELPSLSVEIGAQLLGKAELFNPGGSLKDRVALAMIEAARATGRLERGTTVVEATAGNTGIGLALVCAAAGYRFVAVMTEADRGPKSQMMECLGASVVYTANGLAWDTDDGPLGVAQRIADERSGLFLNQFANPANPAVHERTTAREIADSVGDRVDSVIVGLGTGGTATGLARGLASGHPQVRVIAVAAHGSYLGDPSAHDRIAGITPDFAPSILETERLAGIEVVTAAAAARAARRIMRSEGIPVGHSSGACLVVAEREAKRHPGSTIVILLGDSSRNYPELAIG